MSLCCIVFFFFSEKATTGAETDFHTLSLHDALPICILGDVVRGADLSTYPDDIAHGIRLHRRVDALTDRHPALHDARASFGEGRRRYAGIVLDLVGDYVLSETWPRYSADALTAFHQRAGIAIEAASPWFVQAGEIGRAHV